MKTLAKNWNTLFRVLILFFFLFTESCGGGGGGAGSPNPPGPTPNPPAAGGSQAPALADRAITSLLDVTNQGFNPNFSPNFPANFKTGPFSHQKGLQAVTPVPLDRCNSGTENSTRDDNQTPNDPADDTVTTQSDNCVRTFQGGKTVTHGIVVFKRSAGGYVVTLTNRQERFEQDSTGMVTETTQNGTIAFSGTEESCIADPITGPFALFRPNGRFILNLTSSFKFNRTKDGTLDRDDSSVMNGTEVSVTETFDRSTCTLTQSTVTMNGRVENTDHLRNIVFNTTLTDFKRVATPTTINGIPGEKVSVNGTITIESNCVNGTFILETPVGQEPFFPTEGDGCPVSGKTVTKSGDAATAINYTSTGGVEIDEGNDGSIEKSFTTCNEANTCR